MRMHFAIIIAVFPVIFLGELPDKTMFASLVLATHGKPRSVWLGAAAAFGSALCYALGAIMLRTLARSESTLSIALSFMVAVGLANGIVALPGWVALQPSHWPWIGIVGISGALGQLLLIQAFRAASPVVIAPFEYTALLWGMLLDWLLWRTLPDERTLIGGAFVTLSGLYVIYREHLRSAKRVPD